MPRRLGAAAAAGIGAGVLWALTSLPARGPDLGGAVAAELERSGASNPVTAVLLNLRAWDTLLEVGVLVAALAAAWVLPGRRALRAAPAAGGALRAFSGILVPLSCVVAGALLWKGAKAPGGAFQAAAVLAGAGVVALLAGRVSPAHWRGAPARAVLVLGPGVFLGVGLLGWLARGSFMALAPESASFWILLIESAATLSIAVALVGLFLALGPGPADSEGVPR